MQLRGPPPKGRKLQGRRVLLRSPWKRPGSKASGSGHQRASRWSSHGLKRTSAPAGIGWPRTSSSARARRPNQGTGGKSRIASLTTARVCTSAPASSADGPASPNVARASARTVAATSSCSGEEVQRPSRGRRPRSRGRRAAWSWPRRAAAAFPPPQPDVGPRGSRWARRPSRSSAAGRRGHSPPVRSSRMRSTTASMAPSAARNRRLAGVGSQAGQSTGRQKRSATYAWPMRTAQPISSVRGTPEHAAQDDLEREGRHLLGHIDRRPGRARSRPAAASGAHHAGDGRHEAAHGSGAEMRLEELCVAAPRPRRRRSAGPLPAPP